MATLTPSPEQGCSVTKLYNWASGQEKAFQELKKKAQYPINLYSNSLSPEEPEAICRTVAMEYKLRANNPPLFTDDQGCDIAFNFVRIPPVFLTLVTIDVICIVLNFRLNKVFSVVNFWV